MNIVSVADIKAHFSAYLRAAARGPVVITRSGKAVGVLLAVEDEEELERLVLAYSPRLRTILNAARQRIRAGAGIRHEDLLEELEGGKESKPAADMAASAAVAV
jgi:prevent-host-death family protein